MGKRAVLLTGLAALAVFVLGLVYWREIAVRYEVRRMRRDPDHLIEVIASPEGTVYGQAVRRLFASGDYPGKALLQAYLETLRRADITFTNHLGSTEDQAEFFISSTGNISFHSRCATGGGGGFGSKIRVPLEEIAQLQAIQTFLAEAQFECADIADYPGALFTLSHEEKLTGCLDKGQHSSVSFCFVEWPERRRKRLEEAGVIYSTNKGEIQK